LENGGIDLGDTCPRLHRRIEIDEQFLNVTRDLAADLHVDNRVEGTGGCDRLRDCAPRHDGRLIFGLTISPQRRNEKSANMTSNVVPPIRVIRFMKKCRRTDVGSYC
jgi:hypothetical protein